MISGTSLEYMLSHNCKTFETQAGCTGCGIVPLASRTKDGLMNLAEKLKQLPDGHLTLLNPLTRLAETIVGNTMSYPYRGAILPDGDFRWKQTSRSGSTPVWFAFSGTSSALR